MSTAAPKKRTTAAKRAPAAKTVIRKPKAEPEDRLCVVTPALGKPWKGVIIRPEDSKMGEALDNSARPEKWVIVRCTHKGSRTGINKGLVVGQDYLVLRQFVDVL